MIRYQITRDNLLAVGKQGFRDAGRQAVAASALWWHHKYLPLHFQMIAYLRYKYRYRQTATDRKKREMLPFLEGVGDQTRACGEVLPLVFSGRSRERALGDVNIRATAKSFDTYHADVVIDAPAFNYKSGDKIDPRVEVTTVTAQEEKTLDNLFTREYNRNLQQQGAMAPKRVYKTKSA